MPEAIVTLTDEMPAPPKADIAFEIDFQRGVGPVSRVFSATHDFIKACEALDAELFQSIDSRAPRKIGLFSWPEIGFSV